MAWCGTITRLEWVANLMANQIPLRETGVSCPDPNVKADRGFCRLWRYSTRQQVLAEVCKLVELYHMRGE